MIKNRSNGNCNQLLFFSNCHNIGTERNFSALKRVKTYLRNSMTQSQLNHCMLLHIHRELTENLSLPDIGEEFIKCNDKRINFFGHL